MGQANYDKVKVKTTKQDIGNHGYSMAICWLARYRSSIYCDKTDVSHVELCSLFDFITVQERQINHIVFIISVCP